MRHRSTLRRLLPLLPFVSACFSHQVPARAPLPGESIRLRFETPRSAVFDPPRPDSHVVCPLRLVEGRIGPSRGDSLVLRDLRALRLAGGGAACSVAYSSRTVLLARGDGELTVSRFNALGTAVLVVGIGAVVAVAVSAIANMKVGPGDARIPSPHLARPR